MHILARDVDGDGQDEIAIFKWNGGEIEVWSIGENLQEEVLTMSPDDLEALWDLYHSRFDSMRGDFDGDGQQEIPVELQRNSFEGNMGLVVKGCPQKGGCPKRY